MNPPATTSFLAARRSAAALFATMILGTATLSAAPPWNFANQAPTWPPPTGYLPSPEYSRPVEAIASANPLQITLRIFVAGTYDIYRKTAGAADWGTAIANVTVTAGQTWTDPSVSEGQQYEYKIKSGNYAGYILAGVKIDQTQPKGHFVVVVTSDVVANLPTEYAQYKADLVADGWVVDEVVTTRAVDYTSNGTGAVDALGAPTAPFPSEHINIRNQVIALYNQYPGQVKNVILLGKVPVARSGTYLSGPDGHGNRAALGADAYYADMDGIWTDTESNANLINGVTVTGYTNNPDGTVTFPASLGNTDSLQPTIQFYRDYSLTGGPYTVGMYIGNTVYRFTFTDGLLTALAVEKDPSVNVGAGTVNVAGDNKFDAEYLSDILPNTNVELGFGRVDLSSNIANEFEALRTYLNKAHRYKVASLDFLPGRRAVHRVLYDQVAYSALLSMPGVVGMNNLDFIRSADLPVVSGSVDQDAAWTASNGPYLFYFKGNSVPDFSDGGRAVFWTGLQSHWGYWFETSTTSGQNVMQKRLSENNFTLSYTWSIFGSWYLYQRMGLGYDLGDMMRYSISDKSWANGSQPNIQPNSAYVYTSALFMEQMGDPSLRLFMFAPPTDLSVISAGGNPSLSWTASRPPPPNEPPILGYHVYRAATAAGPFTRITATPVAGTAYTDTSVNSGTYTYLVRAVRLETTGAGSYYNASLGVSQSINLTSGPASLQVATASLPDAYWNTPYQSFLSGQGGTPVYAWSLLSGSLPPGLALAQNGTVSGVSTASGAYHFTVRMTDKLGVTADKALVLNALSNGTATLYPEADNFTTANSPTAVGNPYSDPWTKVAGPVYGYETFMRFSLGGISFNNTLVRAKLLLNIGDSTPIGSYALIKAMLCADAGDGWSESTLNYNNRPADNPAFTPIPAAGFPVRYGTLEIDVTPFVRSTLVNDPARKLTVRLFTTTNLSFTGYIGINSRFAPGNSRPRLVIESTDAPTITISTPTVSPATIQTGSALQISATVAPIPSRIGTTSVLWTKVSGPGAVTFTGANEASSGATFSAPGNYVIRLTANDSVLQSYKDINVRVLAVPADIAGMTGPTNGLILRLPFNEGTGTSTADASGISPANNGTLSTIGATGIPTWITSGKIGKSINFDGVGQRVEVADTAANPLDGMQQLSVSLWVKLNAADANAHAILSKRTSSTASTTSYAITLTNAEKLSVSVANKTAVVGDTVLNVGQWYHVLMIYDGSLATNNLQLYLDGNTQKFGTIATGQTNNIIPRISASPLRVGDHTATAVTASFNGQVDEVRLYNRVLTLDEIQDLAQGSPSNVGPAIIAPTSVTGHAGQAFALNATATDDGQPSPLLVDWNKLTGPGSLIFANAAAATTTGTPSLAGAYTLRLSASDGSITTFADVLATISGGATPMDFSQWAVSHGLPGDGTGLGAAGASPAQDGIRNTLKYALGIDPNIPGYQGRLTTGTLTEAGATYLSLTYVRPDPAPDGVSYEVKTCSDMNGWSGLDAHGVSSTPNVPAPGLCTVVVRDVTPISDTDPARFILLEVESASF